MCVRKNLMTLGREGACSTRGSAWLVRFQEDALDAERFDRLVVSLTRSGTRRGVVRTLSGAILGAAGLIALAGGDAAGKDTGKGKSKRRGNGKGKNRKGKNGVRAQALRCCSGGNCTPGAGKNLAKCCYEDQDLAGKTFKGANLGNANFSGATLTGANFTSANLDRTCFVDADITGARFTGANTGTAIFCRTQTSQGINNSGCDKGTNCCDTCNRAIGETCMGAGDVCCDGATCCDDGCRDLSSDENNCGACGNVCDPGLTCCGGECVDLDTDLNNCTVCGNVCPTSLPNAEVLCGAGLDYDGQPVRGCVFLCGTNFRDCNEDPFDGCEVEIFNNNLHCGTCSDTNCEANNEVCKGCRCVPPGGLSTICQPVGNARLIRRR
jgi:uncharacterized protein YjbI with pentapeptide repeats